MTTRLRLRRAAITALALIASGAAFTWAVGQREWMGWTAAGSVARARVQRGPTVKVDFVLRSMAGHPFHFRRDTAGTVTLLFFGYTSCPDVCPVTLANLAAVFQDLSADERRHVRVVFVSTDPERDTPGRVATWLARFDPEFIGLVGSRREVATVEAALGLTPASTGADPLVIGHTAQVIVFGPDGQSREDHPFGTRQADWIITLRRLLASRGPSETVGRSVRVTRTVMASVEGAAHFGPPRARGGRRPPEPRGV